MILTKRPTGTILTKNLMTIVRKQVTASKQTRNKYKQRLTLRKSSILMKMEPSHWVSQMQRLLSRSQPRRRMMMTIWTSLRIWTQTRDLWWTWWLKLKWWQIKKTDCKSKNLKNNQRKVKSIRNRPKKELMLKKERKARKKARKQLKTQIIIKIVIKKKRLRQLWVWLRTKTGLS